MKEKVMLTLVATMILLLAFAPFVKAAPPILNIMGYTERTQYKPGDSGSITFWVFNAAVNPAILKNITIEYPWFIDNTQLGGNYTILITDTVTLNLNQNYTFTHQFTIPSDGRAKGGTVNVEIGYEYDDGTPPQRLSRYASGTANLPLANTPIYSSIQDFGMLQNLLMLNIIMTLVGAIIIAVALFMTKHRSPMA